MKTLKKKIIKGRKERDWDKAETLWSRNEIAHLERAQQDFNSGSALSGLIWAAVKQSHWWWFWELWLRAPQLLWKRCLPMADNFSTSDNLICAHHSSLWPQTLPCCCLGAWGILRDPPAGHMPKAAGFGWNRPLFQSELASRGDLAEMSVMGSAELHPNTRSSSLCMVLGVSPCQQLCVCFFFFCF